MKVLVRHFFSSLLHPETAAGEDGFVEWLAQLLGLVIAACWLLPAYTLHGRYAYLHGLPSPEPYRRTLEGHFMMTLALVMVLVMLVTALEWPMLFPSRRDHLVLSPLPVSRFQLFAAKLAAVLMFVSIFIAATAGVLGVTLPAVATGTHESHSFLLNLGAHVLGALGAAYFTFFALFAMQGALALALPPRWFAPVSFAVQSALLLTSLCALPLLPYFPARDLVATAWLPPAWFNAVKAWLLGEPQTLAARGGQALMLAIGGTLAAYAVAYARFARKALDTPGWRRAPWRWSRRKGLDEFLWQTLTRGRDQKLVWLLIAGLGVALLAENALYLSRRSDRLGWTAIQKNAAGAAIALPLMLAYFTQAGLRRAFRLPVDPAAHWVFRFSEDEERRRMWLQSVWRMFVALGAGLPWLVGLPALWMLLPVFDAVLVLGWQALLILTLANVLMLDWNQVPFTSYYHPAQRHLIHSIVWHLAVFVPFWLGGSLAIEKSLVSAEWALAWTASSMFGLWWFRSLRLRHLGLEPLEFSEAEPEVVTQMRLS